mgnify:CR=1 FL=1
MSTHTHMAKMSLSPEMLAKTLDWGFSTYLLTSVAHGLFGNAQCRSLVVWAVIVYVKEKSSRTLSLEVGIRPQSTVQKSCVPPPQKRNVS